MNTDIAEILCKITNDFYRSQCDSFSETRQAPWNGWKECVHVLQREGLFGQKELRVFDLACGNLRFESYLQKALPANDITFSVVDNCEPLVPDMATVEFHEVDALRLLLDGCSLTESITAPACDLSVSFGFMHHVPTAAFRDEILQTLIDKTRPGGYVIISLWQFLNNESMREKAERTHTLALEELSFPPLDENDYLLGWKNKPGVYRYCHSFSEEEIDCLITSVSNSATLVSRFVADGRTDNLNTYVILKVK